ncbi:MAG: hypothetical protein ACRBCJ_04245 [Hyphomicrobiaceae bacterium]
MLKRLGLFLFALPIAVLMITLAVANRHGVRLVLDPFRPESPALAVDLPFYIYLFAALVLGVIAGGLSVWFSQSHWRRSARTRSQDAKRWQAEADRLTRERDASIAAGGSPPKQLIGVGQ